MKFPLLNTTVSLLCIFMLAISIACDSKERRFEPSNAELLPEVLPSFSFDSIEGKSISSDQLKGKLRMIHFWATWCPPCVAELPSMQKLYEKFARGGLEIYAISTDRVEHQNKVIEFQKKNKLTFNILLDPDQSLNQQLGVTGYPETILINSRNEILWFDDPKTRKLTKKVIADRKWDSPEYLEAIGSLLESIQKVDK